ncbi:hypothetical protein TMES_21430, partial [Thalassospira mesophila]
VTFAGVPDGAVLSAGTDNGDGTWTVDAADLIGLTLTPPADFSGTLNLFAVATATDGTESATTSAAFSVAVTPVADAPLLSVGLAAGAEDTAIALDVTVASPDTVAVTFAGVPDGAVLSAGTDNGDGTWTVDAADLIGLTLTPPADFSGTLNLFAVATATDGTESATTSAAFSVAVTPVADAPLLSVGLAAGAEDTAIALDINTALTDGNELLSVTIGNIPDGAVLNAGTVNPDGTVTLSPTELTGLTLMPPADFNGDFYLDVTATSAAGADTASVFDVLAVSVAGVADAPTLITVDGSGAEDNAIALDISIASIDTTSITISDIPDGAVLNAGTVNPDGSVTLTPQELSGLTLTPPEDFSGTINLAISATATDGTSTAAVQDVLSITVTPVVDAPTLTASLGLGTTVSQTAPVTNDFVDDGRFNHQGTSADEVYVIDRDLNMNESFDMQGGNDAVTLNGNTTLGNNIKLGDGNDSLTLNGDILLASALDGGNGSDVLYLGKPSTSYFLQNLTINSGVINTQILDLDTGQILTVNNIEAIAYGDGVIVGDASIVQAPAPDLVEYPVTINAGLADTDGSETLSIAVFGVPEGASLNAGTLNPDGSWTVTPADLAGLTLTTPADYSGPIELTVTATSTEIDGTTTSTSAVISPDGSGSGIPSLGVGLPLTILEDITTPFPIDIGPLAPGEILEVTITGLSEGMTLSAGTINPDGSVTLLEADLQGLTLTALEPGSAPIEVTATITDPVTGTSTSLNTSLALDVLNVADAPVLDIPDASGFQYLPIPLVIGVLDLAITEDVSFNIDGLDGATLSAGTLNPDGSYTLEAADLVGLTLTSVTPDDVVLSVTATVTDASTGTSADTTSLVDVDVIPLIPI